MNASTDRLDQDTHARIFSGRIVPERGLNEATSQSKPKAIILGGQPGAGKGGLADAARAELSGDVVTIDPDDLRKFHPRVAEFRSTNPYTWSGRTQPDASAWADELREAATAAKKNFIFDTTLSDGPWTAELIKDLQAKGYEVEVRVVAAHKLESEWGVDQRFSRALDAEGFGRYVPAGARDAIYDKVPASLDTIHAQTDVPIRIFNRDGAELYDSRTDTRPPGPVLTEAREARLRDPKITRGLNRGWQQQVNWHEDLPETIARNPKVPPDTAQRLLAERSEQQVMDGVTRDAAQAHHIDHVVRVRPNVAKGLGAAAVAATAYDIADTTHDVGRLRAQGNAAAAEDRITRFATQNLGGWGGAAAGFAAGAAAGVESGPGLLVTGAVGGIIGAVAGDQMATYIRDYKINHQDDRQGNTWTFDPDHPERGWTRTEGSVLDQALGRARTVTADAALSDELTYKASSQSIALALGAPPRNQDPYRFPVAAGDVKQHHPFETGRAWVRDPQSGHWQQEITELVDGRAPITRHEPASPQQAEALEQRSQAVIAHNARQTPAALAAQFRDAYEQRGWARHGPLPEAVTDALRRPGQMVGSDGSLYERNAQGQWTHDGPIWDSQARGLLPQELEATYQAQQQASTPVTTLDPVVVRPDPEVKLGHAAPATQPYHAAFAPPVAQTSVPTATAPEVPAANSQAPHWQQQLAREHQERMLAHARQEEEARRQEQAKQRETDSARQTPDPLGAASQTAQAVNAQDHAGVRALRERLSERLERQGQLTGLSDDRLTQMAGQMYQEGMRADGRWAVTIQDGMFYAQALDIAHCSDRVKLDLSQSAPSLEQTLKDVAKYDQQRVLEAEQLSRGPDDPSRGRSM